MKRKTKISKSHVHNYFHLTYLLFLPVILVFVIYMWGISIRTARTQIKNLADQQRDFITNPPRQGNITYRVMEGDTVASLAQEFSISKNTIIWANNLTSEELKPGTIIIIPPITGVVHIVKRTDTVESIAEQYHVNPEDILNYPYNRFSDDKPFPLIIGEPLYVPYGRK